MLEQWRQYAKCRDATDLFFPDINIRGTAYAKRIRQAQAICASCPVRKECYQYAIDNEIEYGVWGGIDVRAKKLAVRNMSSKRYSLEKLSEGHPANQTMKME